MSDEKTLSPLMMTAIGLNMTDEKAPKTGTSGIANEKTPKTGTSVIAELIERSKSLETLVNTVLSTSRETEKHSQELLELFTQFAIDVESMLKDHESRLSQIEQGCVSHQNPS